MVYYYTSANVKMIKNIVNDFEESNELSPYEYMKTYIEKCPETTDDSKLSWIVETFLSFEKHSNFLKEIASHLSEELSDQEQKYFMVLFHAIIFQIKPKELQLLYKCIFNLNKSLMSTFTKFLGNNEVLAYIAQVAQVYYDASYVTEKLIEPLFEWQPYIGEMAHSYAEYVKKTESRKLKATTIPIQPNVLNRKCKETILSQSQTLTLPATPPNSMHSKKKKMLTKSTIDKKLKQIHEKNKQKATNLLHDVKNNEARYAQTTKSDKYNKKLSSFKDDFEVINPAYRKPKVNCVVKNAPAVRETATTLKRFNKRIQMEEEEEVQWLKNVICYRNTAKIEEIVEKDRQERERERLLDIEKKHLMGLITHEEAVLAKNKMLDENRKKYEDFLKEKQSWNEEIEKWRKLETEKNRRIIEKQSLTQLNVIVSKNDLTSKRKETADLTKKESEMLLKRAMAIKQEELERKIKMIKEIQALEAIAKNARLPKIIDLTETGGFGFLCEMSIAELQERVSAMKIGLKDELEKKRQLINEEKESAKQELEETKMNIKNYMEERAQMRKYNKKLSSVSTLNNLASKKNDDLKKLLYEKRCLRIKLNNQLVL